MASTKSQWPSTAVNLLLFLFLSAIAKADSDPACRSEWLPLDPGNYWVYREDSRFATANHFTLRVLGPYELDGQVWCQVESPATNLFLRSDSEGRIFQRTLDSPSEQLLLDPQQGNRASLSSPLGFTALTLSHSAIQGLLSTSYAYAREIGLIHSTTRLLTGSSGGFTNGRTLIEASIRGQLYRLAPPTTPDVQLTLAEEFINCAVPCYYAACGLGSPVDLPNTFKPCLQARLHASGLPQGANLLLSIMNLATSTLYQQQFPVSHPSPVIYHSLPWFNQEATGAPVTLFPSGDYLVALIATGPDGKPLASATKAFRASESSLRSPKPQ